MDITIFDIYGDPIHTYKDTSVVNYYNEDGHQHQLRCFDFTEAHNLNAHIVQLRNANFSNHELTRCRFSGMNLHNADFSHANLENADFSSCTLRHANFENASLLGANLHRADLSYANLKRARLINANLTHASLWKARIGGTLWPSPPMMLLAYWDISHVSLSLPELVLALMRYDAANHPDPKLFLKWAHENGHCPYAYLDIQRSANFDEKRTLIDVKFLDRPVQSAYSLMQQLLRVTTIEEEYDGE